MSGAWVGRGGGSEHPIPPCPVLSHPITSHSIAACSIPSHPAPLHPVPSHPIPGDIRDSVLPAKRPAEARALFSSQYYFFPLAFPFSSRCILSRSLTPPPALPQPLSISLNTL